LLHDVRKKIEKNPSKEPPSWIGGNSVTNLKEEWAKPEYQEICAKAKQNRNSDQGSQWRLYICCHRSHQIH
jgi:hypothetical protein